MKDGKAERERENSRNREEKGGRVREGEGRRRFVWPEDARKSQGAEEKREGLMGKGRRRRELSIYSKGEGHVWWSEIKGLYDNL